MEDLVIQPCLAECCDNALLNLLFIIDELELTEAFASTLLDQLFACTMPNAKCMQPLIKIAIRFYKVDYFPSVPNCSICEQENVRSFDIKWFFLSKDLSKWLIDLSATEICSEFSNFINSNLHHFICVIDASLGKHELEARAIAADIELAASR